MIKTEKGINGYGKEITILRMSQKAGEKTLLKEGFANKYNNNTLVKGGVIASYSTLLKYWILN